MARLVPSTQKNGLLSDYVLALHEDRDGALWVGTGQESVAGRTANSPDTHVKMASRTT